jgi:hypothetical protein
VDGRVKPGHDDARPRSNDNYFAASLAAFLNFFITMSRLSFDR